MITTAKIMVGVSLVIQMLWFFILRGLWHALANVNMAGVDKYLKMYVVMYLLSLAGSWYGNKKKGPRANKYWWVGAAIDLVFNIWFVWYAHSVHGLVTNI